jgi:hypothetical protein
VKPDAAKASLIIVSGKNGLNPFSTGIQMESTGSSKHPIRKRGGTEPGLPEIPFLERMES